MKKTLFAMVIGVVAFNVAAQCYPPEYTGNKKRDDALYAAYVRCLDLEMLARMERIEAMGLQMEMSSQTRLLQEQNMLLEEQNDLLRKRRRY